MEFRRRRVLTLLGGAALTGVTTGASASSGAAETSLDELAGSGTETDPYVITTATELQTAADDLDAHYELGGDIDASATSEWNGGAGFDPLGGSNRPFLGTFDGTGHTISGLTIDRPNVASVALFTAIEDGTVEQVSLTDVDVTGGQISAGIAGTCLSGTVRNVSVSGTITGTGIAGGVVGENVDGGTISNAAVSGDVSSSEEAAGGLAGYNFNGSTIETSSASGSVTASQHAGGLVALNQIDASIEAAYATGDVSTDDVAGGIVGVNADGATISETYAANPVSSSNSTGGLAGLNVDNGTVSASYWDTGVVDVPGIGVQNATADVSGLSTSEMQGDSVTETMADFDFNSTWKPVPGDYPELQGRSTDSSGDDYRIDGEFTDRSVFNAISDWRNGETDPQVVFEVIGGWRGS